MDSHLMNILGSAYNDLCQDTTPKKLEEEAELFLNHGDETLIKIGKVLRMFASKHKTGDDPAKYLMNEMNEMSSNSCPCCEGFLASIYYLFFPDSRNEIEAFKTFIIPIQLHKIRQRLQYGLNRKLQPTHYYNLLHLRNKKYEERQNFFLNLKGMSSSSPILYNSALHTDYAGGGFYLKWNGFGIAVDPGYNFAKNLSNYGLTIHDIQAVIITHDHIDHSSDARLLLDMEYQINKAENRDNYIHWFVDPKTAKTLKTWTNFRKENLTIINPRSLSIKHKPGRRINPNNTSILLYPFLTEHVTNDKGETYQLGTFGFVMKLQDEDSCEATRPYFFGYTSDTTYFPELSENFNQMDFLLANISSVRKEELIQQMQNKRHLGLTGMTNMLQNIRTPPKLLAISEFWSGISDIRYDITSYIGEYLRALAGDELLTVVPLESGISIEIPSNSIRCTFCETYAKRIYVLRPKADFEEIQFACSECIY